MRNRWLTDHALLFLISGICAALLFPALFMDGMFSDGTQYAAVSRNFADGSGTFWTPHYTKTFFPVFTEQPPLMFFLQGIFFKLFGSGFYVERFYCAVMAVLTAITITRTWKIIAKEKTTSWYAILLWFTSPVIFYAYTENLAEATMTLFVMLALNSILKGLIADPQKNIHWFIAGMWLLAAGLTKGVQGMFLLSAPFWVLAVLKNGTWKQFISRSFLIALVPVLFVMVALLVPAIHDSLDSYFSSRFSKTFSGVTAHSQNRFHMLFELFLDSIPAIVITLFFIIIGRKTASLAQHWKEKRSVVFFLLACGFSGILPLMITLEQRGFYLATPLPILLIALAYVVQPAAVRATEKICARPLLSRTIAVSGLILLASVLVVTVLFAGTPRRDAEKIAALHEVAAITGDDLIVRSTDALNADWGFIAYGQRYHKLSFTEKDRPELLWLITEKGFVPGPEYAEVPLKTQVYSLFQK